MDNDFGNDVNEPLYDDPDRVNRDKVDDEAGTGATGQVANAVVGANVGDGISGSLAGALMGQLTATDVEDKAGTAADADLPQPLDLDALGAFAKGEDTGAITDSTEDSEGNTV